MLLLSPVVLLTASLVNATHNFLHNRGSQTPNAYLDDSDAAGTLQSPAWSRQQSMAIVAQMTLDEKVNLTTGIEATRCVGQSGSVSRMGIPSLCFADGPSGVRNRLNVSQFPAQITAAATWDLDLISQRARALGQEYHDVGANVMFGPIAGGPSGRSPLGGRYWEGNGGDEYLSGAITLANVKAAQEQGIVATLKHFLGYEQETARGMRTILPTTQQPYSVNVDDDTVHQTYLWPFAEGVRAGAGLVMCAYNRINGQHACSSNDTLNGLLKNELNFQGAVVSDYGAVWSLDDSVNHGMDLLMPGDGQEVLGISVVPNDFGTNGEKLKAAVHEGRIAEARVDDMVGRILAPVLHYQNGLKGLPALTLDGGNSITGPYGSGGRYPDVQRDHREVIRRIGTESLTLLKNDVSDKSGLPLNLDGLKTIAILGGDAGPHEGHPVLCTSLGGCLGAPKRTVTIGEGSGYAVAPYISDPLSAIKAYVAAHNPSVNVTSDLSTPSQLRAVDLAREADAAVVFVSQVRVEGSDQSSYELEDFDEDLILKVAAVNQNTIVFLHAPAPVGVEKWVDHANVTAVLLAYYPGQESGNSLTPVLFGDESPSGRLPFTVAKSVDDYQPNHLFRPSAVTTDPQLNLTEGDLIDWKWFDNESGERPRFWFGEGLSYTTFAYGNLTISATPERDTTSIQPTNEVLIDESATTTSQSASRPYDVAYTVTVPVANTGARAAKHVVQLYVSLPGVDKPRHLLRGFAKLSLAPGETQMATFPLRNKDLSRWDTQRKAWVKRRGTYHFYVPQGGAGKWTTDEGTAVGSVEM